MFYHYSKDDLEELKKLSVAIEKQKIALITTGQLRDEFYRNRETKIADAIRNFKKDRPEKGVPEIFKQEISLYEKLTNSLIDYQNSQSELINKAYENAKNYTFQADDLIKNLFNKSLKYEETDLTYNKADQRIRRGRPPGKKNSIGDTIIWETLLKRVPRNQDLHFISWDGDYASELFPQEFNPYLIQEWKNKKDSQLIFYNTLSAFLNAEYPEIKLATDLEKKLALDNLLNSGSFSSTHTAIAVLKNHSEQLTPEDYNKIINAGLDNDQIYGINDDEDVRAFYSKIFNEHQDLIPQERFNKFKRFYISPKNDDLTCGEYFAEN